MKRRRRFAWFISWKVGIALNFWVRFMGSSKKLREEYFYLLIPFNQVYLLREQVVLECPPPSNRDGAFITLLKDL